MSGFTEFCGGDAIFDENLLLNNTWPELTACFQNVLLVWVPCGYLWLSLPFYLVYLYFYSDGFVVANNKLNWAKKIICIVLAVLAILAAVEAEPDPQSFPDKVAEIVYWNGGIEGATYLLAAILIHFEMKKGVVTSGVLWFFWLFTVIANIVPLYTKIYLKELEEHAIPTIIFYIYYSFLVLQLLVSSFAEKPSFGGHMLLDLKMCKERLASYPSKLTFWWMNSLVLQAAGRTLVEDDIYDLHIRDSCQRTVPKFCNNWNQEMAKAKNKQKETVEVARSVERPGTTTDGVGESTYGKKDEKSPLLGEHRASKSSSGTEVGPGEKGDQDGNSKSGSKKTLPPASLSKVLFKTYIWEILPSHFCILIYDLLQFADPYLLGALIDYTSDRQAMEDAGQQWKGYVYACALFVVSTISSIAMHQCYQLGMTLGMRVKGSLVAAVFKKSLTISNEARKGSTLGEIVNHMSVDCQLIQDLTPYLWLVWSSPLMIGIALWMLWNLLGVSILAGLLVMILLIPANGVIASRLRKLQFQQMKYKDQRIKLMTEVLGGIKVLKLYAWEPSFRKKVEEIRNKEVELLRSAALLSASITVMWTIAPYIVTLSTFACYVMIDESHWLDAETCFVALSLFNILNVPINLLPLLLAYLVQAAVSVSRLSKFLRQEDLDPNTVTYDSQCDAAVSITGGTFTWDKENPTPTLKDISVKIEEGKLVAVVGSVGSGKSSLISAILGEMEKIQGNVTVKSSVAYVPQQAWIQNMSLKANILFSAEYNHSAYTKVIDACCLLPDLDVLPSGDMTEIGEKGINLSGGQKQRVSLARAVYNDADIYLLDDPLSAVDSHVGKHIFEKIFSSKGLLKKKTRVLVTHGVQWLPLVDHIIVMTDGVISETGTYDELISQNGVFAQFLKQHLNEEDSDDEDEDPEISAIKSHMIEKMEEVASDTGAASGDDISTLKRKMSRRMTRQFSKSEKKKEDDVIYLKEKTSGKLVTEEESEVGKVALPVFLDYFKAIGVWFTVGFTLLYCCFQGTSVYASLWLTAWTDDPTLANRSLVNTPDYNETNDLYLGVYGGLGIVQVIFILGYAFMASLRMVTASASLHENMLCNVVRCPMSFFDTTPSGRILNRFSQDVQSIDITIPSVARSWMTAAFNTLATLIVISYTTPIFMAVIVPLGIVYYILQRLYIPTSRQLKRIESTTRSPIYTHFGETIAGAASIRAYKETERFILDSEARVNRNFKLYFSGIAAKRWLAVRLEFLGNLLVLAAAMFAVFSQDVSDSLVGLSVTYALQITGNLNTLVNCATDLETNIVSVERVRQYIQVATEASWINPFHRPLESWPTKGCLHFRDYQMRYRPNTDLVLKGLNCEISGGEKIGIVGRTGAGKSSMTVSLFRLIEAAGGQIDIDGINIADIGLHDLRSRITILPQEPVLFSGSLRMNLDPFDSYDDAAIWRALEHAHLKTFVESAVGGLTYQCGEEGQNLSVGQRQLVCLARALLRKTKILILDEATAAVDMETDELIQATIRSQFKDATVLTIAHRLNTIMDYDRIMVLSAGEIVEFDAPNNLLDDKESTFYGMAKDANLV